MLNRKFDFAAFAFSACTCASFAFSSAALAFWSSIRMMHRIIRNAETNTIVTTTRLSFTKSITVTFFIESSYMDSAPVSMEDCIASSVLFRTASSSVSPRQTANETSSGCVRKTLWSFLSSIYRSSSPDSARKQSASPSRTAFSTSSAESYVTIVHFG